MAIRNIWGPRLFTVLNTDSTPFRITLKGRDLWALDALMRAGPIGCTPITNPAPRWSAYVHNLRALGVAIETLTEPHSGPFSGSHGRYVLRSEVMAEGKQHDR